MEARKVEISVVIPMYNEEKVVKELYGRLKMVLENIKKGYEIVFIDDGSKDDTFKLLKEYSHKDKDWKRRLIEQLNVLGTAGILQLWDDSQILPGSSWRDDIERAMSNCQIAVMLVSRHSLTSKFILDVEVKRFLERRDKEGLDIYPLIVSDCAWQHHSWLAQMLVRPKDGKPLNSFRGHRLDEVLADVAREIAIVLKRQGSGPDEDVLFTVKRLYRLIEDEQIASRDFNLLLEHTIGRRYEPIPELNILTSALGRRSQQELRRSLLIEASASDLRAVELQDCQAARRHQLLCVLKFCTVIIKRLRSIKFVFVPPGTVVVDNREMVNRQPFFMSERPVSEREWEQIMEPSMAEVEQGSEQLDKPKVNISVNDVRRFLDAIAIGHTASLTIPTEHQLEFATLYGLEFGDPSPFGMRGLGSGVRQFCLSENDERFSTWRRGEDVARRHATETSPVKNTGMKLDDVSCRLVLSAESAGGFR